MTQRTAGTHQQWCTSACFMGSTIPHGSTERRLSLLPEAQEHILVQENGWDKTCRRNRRAICPKTVEYVLLGYT